MAETDPEKTVGSETMVTNPADPKPSSPTPAQDDATDAAANDVDVSANPAEDDATNIADAIQALEKKVLELKKHVKAGPADPRPKILSDLEKSRHMEAIMYKHRKEWERNVGPGKWGLDEVSYPSYFDSYLPGGEDPPPWRKWSNTYRVEQEREYKRPNPFDCLPDGAETQEDVKTDADGEFDRTIHYGDRRDRLRKNFEWEMDRLYLEEEMDRRKQERRKEELHSGEQPVQEENVSENQPAPPPPEFAQPKLHRLDWTSFRRIYRTEGKSACVLDILVGEPMIDNDSSRRWYGRSRRRVRKLDAQQDGKDVKSMGAGQLPLPERIRVHSPILLLILNDILGKELEHRDGSFVLLRPFKSLAYCEPELRAWCSALETKYAPAPQSENEPEATTSANDSKIDLPEDNPDSNDPGMDPSLVPADDCATRERPAETNFATEAADQSSGAPRDGNSVDREDKAEQARDEDGNEDQGEGEEGSDEEESDEEDNSNELTKSETALEHLKCLLDFIDSDISVKRSYLSSSKCRKVLFSDLWLLFRPGVEVIGSDGKQAYRVISATSAKHGAASRWDWFGTSKNRRKKQAPFTINCVYIDFDGENLGPVLKVFDFKRFDGERDVTSLEVYPLRFHPVKRPDFSDSEWKDAEALPENQRYRRKLIRRGVKFLDVAAVKHMYYAGPTLEVREEVESQVVIDFETAFAVEDDTQKWWRPYLTPVIGNSATANNDDDVSVDSDDDFCYQGCCYGEVVHDDSDVDQKETKDYVNSLLPKQSIPNDQPSIAIIPRPLEELQNGPGNTLITDEELVIMSYRVFGFVLRSRKWAKLDLSYLTEANRPELEISSTAEGDSDPQRQKKKQEQRTAFDRLVLENWHRNMIVSLISQHFRDKESKTGRSEEFDIVKGKGKGLIILLHGAPGVGKTSTAEGVAELFKKPLFQITCGDLGTTASEVEKALETNFALASRWDCILLLDEADVFLSERTKEDFKRNGLVAVFLRVMEYYTGILFLTTNRVGDFDEAFTSRIHISLYYPHLNDSKTVDVFTINMDMIEERCRERGRKIDIDRVGIGSFASKHFQEYPKARWNGRQIRNACQTALALAEFEAQGNSHKAIPNPNVVVTLGVRHFEIVRDAYVEFTKYMNDIYGTNASRRAKDNFIRAMWNDESEAAKAIGAAAFLLASQGKPHANYQQPSPQQLPQQPPPPQQQTQYNPYPYQNYAAPQPGYPTPGQVQVQAPQYTTGQPWVNPVPMAPNSSFQGSQTEMPGVQQPPMTPPQRQYQQQYQQQQTTQPPQQQPQYQQQQTPQQHPQHQPPQQVNHPGFNQGIQAIYEASGQPTQN